MKQKQPRLPSPHLISLTKNNQGYPPLILSQSHQKQPRLPSPHLITVSPKTTKVTLPSSYHSLTKNNQGYPPFILSQSHQKQPRLPSPHLIPVSTKLILLSSCTWITFCSCKCTSILMRYYQSVTLPPSFLHTPLPYIKILLQSLP